MQKTERAVATFLTLIIIISFCSCTASPAYQSSGVFIAMTTEIEILINAGTDVTDIIEE